MHIINILSNNEIASCPGEKLDFTIVLINTIHRNGIMTKGKEKNPHREKWIFVLG